MILSNYNYFMKSFEIFFSNSIKKEPVAVVNPNNEVSLLGAMEAESKGLIKPLLIGNTNEIKLLSEKLNLSLNHCELIEALNEEEILKTTVELAQNGKVKAIMKGNIDTGSLLKAIVKKENNLRGSSVISHLFAISVPSYHKLFFLTDAAINIEPNADQKKAILENAIKAVQKLGIKNPKIAMLSATEKANSKMKSSIEALEIANEFKNSFIIEGPLAFDVIINKKAAEIKKINSQVAGDVDLIISPNIETANTLFKALTYLANAKTAGVVLGAKVPIILTSRSDNQESRLLSCAFSNLLV